MKRLARLLAALLVGLLSLVVTGFGPPSLIESDADDAPVPPSILKEILDARPTEIVAKSAIVIDAVSGRVVYGKDIHTRRAMASTTKIMTALVTLENARLDDIVTAGPAVKSVEPTIIGLDPGDELTVEEMLHGLLLPSGNDAAVALAEHVGGSVEAFAAMMNDRAEKLGLTDTHFSNPHGLDADDHYTSAYDLAIIAREAMKNPVFERIVSTRELVVKEAATWLFRNSNLLLRMYSGADGIKTGYTDNAGRCLVLSATREGRRAIAVVLDSESQWSDAAALADHFFADFVWETVPAGGSPLSTYADGEAVKTASPMSRPELMYPRWQRPYVQSFYRFSSGTAPAGASVGRVEYSVFGREAALVDLYGSGG